MIDFTNDQAREWTKQLIKSILYETEAGGWLHDSGEFLPYDAVMYDQSHPLEYHTRYIEDWTEVAQEATMEMGVQAYEQTLFFMSAGTLRTPPMNALLSISQSLTTYSDMQQAMIKQLNGAVSGFILTQSEIGG